MRIDASNLLLAAQVQLQRPGGADKAAQPRFEPLDFAKASPARENRHTASPGPVPRPGAQLDIKV